MHNQPAETTALPAWMRSWERFWFTPADPTLLGAVRVVTGLITLYTFITYSFMLPDMVGAVMSDLASRRGRVLGTDKVGEDRTLVKAEIPEVELTRYAIDLRSLSHGAGSFTRSFARYEPMPESAASKVKASA